jgi:hypothetical protein
MKDRSNKRQKKGVQVPDRTNKNQSPNQFEEHRDESLRMYEQEYKKGS